MKTTERRKGSLPFSYLSVHVTIAACPTLT
jgi:hypothetical protein